MNTMTLWNGMTVPRIGIGCWAIGGPMYAGDTSLNYGDVDDTVSLAGLRLAHEMGARVFDTAAVYGCGHSEELLGEAFGDRDDIVIVTKFGATVDTATRQLGPPDLTNAGIRASVEASRRNLKRDRIDLVLLHVGDVPIDEAGPIFDTLADLRNEGKLDAFGWSTDFADRTRAAAAREGFVAVEHDFNVFTPATELVDVIEGEGLLALSRLPLAMGLLTGKYSRREKLPGNDIRAQQVEWMRFFREGEASPEYIRRLEALRELLTMDGRSLAQGALAWILARTPAALPVPGFKTEAQVRDNFGTLEKGPLPQRVMNEIDALLSGFEQAV